MNKYRQKNQQNIPIMGDFKVEIGSIDRPTRFQVNPVRHSQQQQYNTPQQPLEQPSINPPQLNGGGNREANGIGLDEGMTLDMYRTTRPDGDTDEIDTYPDEARASLVPPRLSR